MKGTCPIGQVPFLLVSYLRESRSTILSAERPPVCSYLQVADSIDGRKRAIQIERMEILAIIGIIVLGLIIFTSVGILGHLFDVFIV